MPSPIKYVPVLQSVMLGSGGISKPFRGAFDNEKTDQIEYDILITESGDEITDGTTEVNLAP